MTTTTEMVQRDYAVIEDVSDLFAEASVLPGGHERVNDWTQGDLAVGSEAYVIAVAVPQEPEYAGRKFKF